MRHAVFLLGAPDSDATMVERVRGILQRQVEHLVRLVDDLLDVARLVHGQILLRRESVEVATFIERAVESVQPVLEQQRHRLDVSLPAGSLKVDGDAVRLTQIVSNLLQNAIKYTRPGGRIEIRADASGPDITVRVRDDGDGIAPDKLAQIFELFAQARGKSMRQDGGLGIGLTLARRLAELHGGTLSAHSAGIGEGSEFTLRLPRSGLSAGQGALRTRSVHSPGEGRRILIVDDNVDAAEMLAAVVSQLGSHVIEIAHDGLRALELAESFDPDVALVDLGLPQLDGLEVGRRLRRRGRPLLLVAVTGYGQASDQARTRAAGFDHHLTKPVSIESLETLLSESRQNS